MRKQVLLSTLLACTLWQPAATHATPILDQAHLASATSGVFTEVGTITRAQTFTVGIGGVLTYVDVLLESAASLGPLDRTFAIYPTLGGAPDLTQAALAQFSVTIAGGGASDFYRGDVSAGGVIVSPGDVLAIVYSGGSETHGHWWVGTSRVADDYLGGHFFTGTVMNPGQPVIYPGYEAWDLCFRTWVDEPTTPPEPDPVPEPATLALLAVGLGLARGIERRRPSARLR